MDEIIETYNLLRLNHEEIENLNRPTTSKEIESIIKILPPKNSQDQMVSGEYYQTFNKKLVPVLLKLF